MKKLCLVLVIGLLMITSASADDFFKSGNGLIDSYREFQKYMSGQSYNAVSGGHYQGYVLGVYDALSFMEGFTFSTPSSMTGGQLFAVVGKYLEAHPERWSESAARLVEDALKETFPVKK